MSKRTETVAPKTPREGNLRAEIARLEALLAECAMVLGPFAWAFEHVDDRIRGETDKDYRGMMAAITIGDLRAADALLAKLKAQQEGTAGEKR